MLRAEKTYSETNDIDMSYVTDSDKDSDLYKKLQNLADALNELTVNKVFYVGKTNYKTQTHQYLYVYQKTHKHQIAIGENFIETWKRDKADYTYGKYSKWRNMAFLIED